MNKNHGEKIVSENGKAFPHPWALSRRELLEAFIFLTANVSFGAQKPPGKETVQGLGYGEVQPSNLKTGKLVVEVSGFSEVQYLIQRLYGRRQEFYQDLQALCNAMMVPHLWPERQSLRVMGPRARVVPLLLRDDSEPEVRLGDACLHLPSLKERQAFLVQGRRRLVVTLPAGHLPKLADEPGEGRKVQLSGAGRPFAVAGSSR